MVAPVMAPAMVSAALAQATAKPACPAALSMVMLVTLAPAILAPASPLRDWMPKMARPALPADCRRPTPADRH